MSKSHLPFSQFRRCSGRFPVAVLGAFLLAFACACGRTALSDLPRELREMGIDASVQPPVTDAGDGSVTPSIACTELPFQAPSRGLTLPFEARVGSADVLFLIDTTGSMNDEIDTIRASIRNTLLPGLKESIPDARFAVAAFADFSVTPFGTEDDRPYRMLQTITDDVNALETATTKLSLSNGGDEPEAQVEALYQTVTGAGLGTAIQGRQCPADSVGYPCFRDGASPIILLFTDNEFHNGPQGINPYSGLTPPPHTYDDTVSAMRAANAKVLGLYSGTGAGLETMRTVARDTGAIDSNMTPLVIDIGVRGVNLTAGVIDVTKTFIDQSPLNVDLAVEDVAGDAIDATKFVKAVRAVSSDPADAATNAGDHFENVRPGTLVSFAVELSNDDVEQRPESQAYDLRLVLRRDGVTRLKETRVHIVIPGTKGGGC